MRRDLTYGILLNAGNAAAIAEYEDISVETAARLIARDLAQTTKATDYYVLFGYTTTGGAYYDTWIVVTAAQLEWTFKDVNSDINNKIVKLVYKD